MAIGLVGARGTDAAFTSFIKDTMKSANISQTVDVGRTAFKLNAYETNDVVEDSTVQIHQNQNILLGEFPLGPSS